MMTPERRDFLRTFTTRDTLVSSKWLSEAMDEIDRLAAAEAIVGRLKDDGLAGRIADWTADDVSCQHVKQALVRYRAAVEGTKP